MENTKCECCGASLKAYWHTLTPGLVSTLIRMIQAVKTKGVNEIHLQKEVEMTKNQYNNFQKLRFFGLVAKVRNDDSTHKTGYWLITNRGGEFLRGKISIPRRVKTFRNQVEDHDPETVFIYRYLNQFPWFETEFQFEIVDGKVIT